jgi:hypothetical protein
MGKALVKNAASEEQVKEAAQTERHRKDTDENDLRFVLSTVAGRRFMWKLIGDCAPLRNPMGSDALNTYFHIGRADIGRQLYSQIMSAAPEAFIKMQSEAMAREEKNV